MPTKSSVPSHRVKPLRSRGGANENSKENYNKSLINKVHKQFETEFKILTGSQEYNVQRIKNSFIVRPCSSIRPITTSTVTFKIDREKSHEEMAKEKEQARIVSAKQSKVSRHASADLVGPKSSPSKQSYSPKKKDSQISSTSLRVSSPTAKVSSRLFQDTVLSKKSREFINLVNQAIKLQKIFSIGNQNRRAFPTVRQALKNRGWVEKCAADTFMEEDLINNKTAEVTYRLLKEAPVNFVWVVNAIDFSTVTDETVVSRFPKSIHFSTKVGLWNFMEDFHWFYQPNISKTITPKTFRVASKGEMDIFIKEFGLTACVSLLKIIVNQVSTAESDSFFRNGVVPLSVFDFANAQCSEYILHRHHDDIDRKVDGETSVGEWKNFLFWYYKIAHENENFETTSYPMIQALYTMSKMTLKNMEPYWHLLNLEGHRNLWVIKPPADFCGRGVRVMQNLDDIVNHVQVLGEDKYSRCIIQKYIEKPLLIYDTKFDIRQWFLITSVYPLVIWMYKECYLRFSSQPFSLNNLHESVHLTNNAIQKNYTNSSLRDSRLPAENMWHCNTLKEYLKEIGELDKWHTTIVPGMKEGIVGAVLASQDEMIDRQNSFELYGADFLLGNDFTPILLEINMGPAMAPSTSVTAELCKKGLEDVIKVVLDRKHNMNADTGLFELVYKQEMGPRYPHAGIDLVVCGSKITPEKRLKPQTKT